jgi:RNA polymerase sigma-70 factor (ECF subfamily)
MESTLTGPWCEVPRGEELTADRFDDLVRSHQSRIYRILWCELHDEDAAATLTQECFLRAYQNRGGFRGESSVSTWLIHIALNLATDYRRNRRQGFWRNLLGDSQEVLEATAPAGTSPGPERTLAAREELAAVMHVVASLSGQQRTAFMLRFVEDMSIQEIADSMGLEPGTVKSHLARAVGAVRRMKQEETQ